MATVNMDRLLQACVSQGSSDIHLVVNRAPVFRIDGQLRSLETKVLEPDDTVALMKSITPERNQQELQEEGGTDFGFAFGSEARFRVSIFKQKGNITVVLRLIPTRIMSFEEIGLPKICSALCHRPRGMFLVTGPTGCGKTTTLATMVNYINENLDRHIITIEDPIEYYHTHKKSIVNQREVGVDVPSFSEALRRVLRMDPDVILVGELRDLETIEAAVRAAETGHLVFSTLHTTSAAGTVTRIIDVFPIDQQEQIRIQLSSNLLAVLSQALCPLATGKGRIAAYEFMVVTPAISNLIRENKSYRIDSSIQTGKRLGMQLLDEHLWHFYDMGKITLQEMLDKARQPGALQDKATAKMAQLKGLKGKKRAKMEEKEIGPILRT
jgi:twitching motility protein PilT